MIYIQFSYYDDMCLCQFVPNWLVPPMQITFLSHWINFCGFSCSLFEKLHPSIVSKSWKSLRLPNIAMSLLLLLLSRCKLSYCIGYRCLNLKWSTIRISPALPWLFAGSHVTKFYSFILLCVLFKKSCSQYMWGCCVVCWLLDGFSQVIFKCWIRLVKSYIVHAHSLSTYYSLFFFFILMIYILV